MRSIDLISKIADYVLLNAYSLESSGFYYGKAGVSLALFEVAHLTKSNYIENHAFELLQESLLYKGNDSSWSDGYTGIGYVLNYLTKNNFVETDIAYFNPKEQIRNPNKNTGANINTISTSKLANLIDRLYLLRQNEKYYKKEIKLLESFIFSTSENRLESKLISLMHSKGQHVSINYAEGLSRWLLYAVYVESAKCNKSVSRFENLFKPLHL